MLHRKLKHQLIVIGTSIIASTPLLTTFNHPHQVHADTVWIAKTPSEIGHLNHNGTYTVQEGDTIWAIGMHFNIKPIVIENVNAIKNPYDLQIGTVLKLHVYDHGKKATFYLQSGHQKVKAKLNNSDKLDQHESFGKAVKPNQITANVQSNTPSKQPAAKNTKTTAQKTINNINTNHNTNANQNQNATHAVTTSQSYNDNAIAMAAYNESYNQHYGKGNHVGVGVYISKNKAGQYIIGQGTSDSTATITINGNTVVTSFPNIKDARAVSYDTQTFNIQQLMNQQYHTSTQQSYINKMVNTGYKNMNQLNQTPHPTN